MISQEIIGLTETAEILGISKASIRNWVKHGYLKPLDNTKSLFYLSSVIKLKDEIQNGKIDRLKKRANKSRANKRFIPTEYITDINNQQKVNRFVEYILVNDLDIPMSIFVLALNCLRQEGEIKRNDLKTILSFSRDLFRRENVLDELQNFYKSIPYPEQYDLYEYLLEGTLPLEQDILGIIYQSLIHEGLKANMGSYFTPGELVDEMVGENIQSEAKVLDPCCGTGQFLLAFARYIDNPENIVGFDLDQTAVQIARINLLLQYPIEFTPQIIHCDTLKDIYYSQHSLLSHRVESAIQDLGKFDFIATNPPWGAEIEKNVLNKLKSEFPQIHSKESFSFFLSTSLHLLKEQGHISFVLPEAILNVNTHSDIRKKILGCCQIRKIRYHGKKFKNVFSSAITMDLKKTDQHSSSRIMIEMGNHKYEISQQRFSMNNHFVFDIYLNDKDQEIINQVYAVKHTTLKDQAEWALGIVTGDNHKYLVKELAEDLEPIYRGADVNPYKLKKPKTFIKFSPERFQQVAPEAKYRAKEKLIYRFISNDLVFAYDDKESLTLNSANILIPKIPDYPLKVVLALLNSSLYQFIHRKKFNSIKILRGNLEQLPIPLWNSVDLKSIEIMADQILEGKDQDYTSKQIDSFIFVKYNLTDEQQHYIQKTLRSSNGKA